MKAVAGGPLCRGGHGTCARENWCWRPGLDQHAVQDYKLFQSGVSEGVLMFDWNAELKTAKRQVAELEERLHDLRETLKRVVDEPTSATPIERILDQAQRTLSIRMASLDRAKFHARFIEHKLAMGGKVFNALPYLELAQVCFNSAKGMPAGNAAEVVRTHAAAFYTKSLAQRKASSPD
jgi:hypothetical protein